MTDEKNEKGLQKLSVLQVFNDDSYLIPIYQRDYAWKKSEIHTLLIDVHDARELSEQRRGESGPREYYIGTLVVDTSAHDELEIHEVVDGQQRLTTLFMVLAIVPRIFDQPVAKDADYSHQAWSAFLLKKLSFEGRPGAHEDLRRLAQRGEEAISTLNTDGIREAAKLIAAAANRSKPKETTDSSNAPAPSQAHRSTAADAPVFTKDDLRYLLTNVKMLRATLPPGTDLNHYFEVMNTRGEQLEKHEILKARLMNPLAAHPIDQLIFSQIWDACSVLDRHIQVQFSTTRNGGISERERIFGDSWDHFVPPSWQKLFDELQESHRGSASDFPPGGQDTTTELADILNADSPIRVAASGGGDSDESSSYGSIIDFPNFLLHVLKTFCGEEFRWADEIDSTPGHVRLEDKYLLEEFDRSLLKRDSFDADDVRAFAYLLLKTRFLLDSYVIRTQANAAGDQDENWVLHRAYKYVEKGGGSPKLTARNTFRASGSDVEDDIEGESQRRIVLLQAMFQVTDSRRSSKYFLFHMLQWLNGQDHHTPVSGPAFVDLLENSARERLAALYSKDSLDLGTKVQNFLFNVLDYELWRLASDQDRTEHVFRLSPRTGKASALALKKGAGAFHFRYRTSVEHFYPQKPATSDGHKTLPPDVVDKFGNLCIMSRTENSRRSNLMPVPKAEQFASTSQSLNFQIMAAIAKNLNRWTTDEISDHGEAMRRLLEDVINSHKTRSGQQLT